MVSNPETEVFLRISSQRVSVNTNLCAILRVEGAGFDAVSSPYLPWAA